MEILLGIIILHLLILVRAKQPDGERVPYFSTFFLSLIIVFYVVYMMFTMEMPNP